jgi:CMP-2-keto-3-deoxyoctulosonic acid synthetase
MNVHGEKIICNAKGAHPFISKRGISEIVKASKEKGRLKIIRCIMIQQQTYKIIASQLI